MRRSSAPLLMRKTLWILYLAIAMVFIQSAQLHVHLYDHAPITSDHGHHVDAHFSYDTLEVEHHDKVTEVDLSQQVLLKNYLLGSLVIAFFVAVIVILSPRYLIRRPRRYDRQGTLIPWSFSLRPPLRAPPL